MFFPTTFCLLFRDIIPDNIDEEFNMEIQTVFHVIIGLLFISLGVFYYHRQFKTYYSFKTVWCKRNPENWYATHKFTGIVWIISGILVFSTLYVRMNDLFFILSTLFAFMLITPIAFSFFFHLNQLKRGTAFDEDDFETPEDKQLALLGLILGIILFAISIPLVTTGHINYKFTSSEFKTSGTYWHATRIKYKDIVNVKFSKKEIPGTRIEGFNGFKTEMGDFYNFDYKYFKKYTYKKNDSCVVIFFKNDYLIINETNYKKTKQLYKKICSHLRK